MLVLSRKLGEKIYIGDGVVITVVDIDRNKVRLGVVAPGQVVDREEVHNRKLMKENSDGKDTCGNGQGGQGQAEEDGAGVEGA